MTATNIFKTGFITLAIAFGLFSFALSAEAAASCPANMTANTNASGNGQTLITSGSPISASSCLSACVSYSDSVSQAVSCGLASDAGGTYCAYEWCDPTYGCGCAQYVTVPPTYYCAAGNGPLVSQSGVQGAQCSYTPEPPVITFSSNQSTVTAGQSATLSWSAGGPTPISCTASGGWSGSKATIGSQSVSPSSTTTYTLACSNSQGSDSKSVSITVLPAPSATIDATPSTVYLGQNVTISWFSTNATSCSGSGFSTGGATGGSQTMTMSSLGNFTYGVTCTNAGGVSASASKTVTVSAPPGSSCDAGIGVYPSTTTVFSGDFWTQIEQNSSRWNALVADTQANGGVTPTLGNDGWYANKATADRICSILWPGSHNGGYGADDFATPGGHYMMVWNGSSWQKPNAASGWNNHLTGNFTCLQDNSAPATAKLPSSKVSVSYGTYTEWTDPTGGMYGGSGSSSSGDTGYCPTYCTQYAAANGINGTYYCGQETSSNSTSFPICLPGSNGESYCADYTQTVSTQTCYVGGSPVSAGWNPPSYHTWAVSCTYTQPAVTIGSFTASPTSVNSGGSSTLTWSSSNATSCSASGGWNGAKATSGSQAVTPSSSTTYTLICTGPGGSATQSVTVTVTLQCSDGIDNDSDGLIDLADYGCTGASDTTESPNPQCSDGIDNDADGKVDLADPGCTGPTDTTEANTPTPPQCSDGLDNDGDGPVDAADPDCAPGGPGELPWCEDGLDNDGDGLIDDADPDCGLGGPGELPWCEDGLDNDGDGLIDAADPECNNYPPDDGELPWCEDGLDNDGDGLIDDADPNCNYPPEDGEEPQCSDDIDNDGDGKKDMADTGCSAPDDDSEAEEPNLPDLTFHIGNVTPTTVYVGAQSNFQATVWNDGPVSTGIGFTNLFQRANDDIGTGAVIIGTHERTSGLNAGANFDTMLPYTFSSIGVWWVRACTDNDVAWQDDILESDEGNNCGAWTKITVVPPGSGECSDGDDNDGDGRTDTDDYGCSDASDPTESPNPECSDGIDNDSDGRTDTLDYACAGNPAGTSEAANPECSDGEDNDGDNFTDSDDYGCVGGPTDEDESPNPECSNGSDDDGDTLVDGNDLGCFGPGDANEETSTAVTALAVANIAGTALVQRGNPATLNWSASESVSCRITSSRGYDSGNLAGPFDGSPRTHTTSAVNAQTDFTLTCVNEESAPTSSTVTVFLAPDTGEI